jgi:hypothetical protein
VAKSFRTSSWNAVQGFASLGYARDPSRTRIVPYCHTSGVPIPCSGPPIANVDQAPETGSIVLSFLANTSGWTSTGTPNQTQYGGVYFALENAAGTQYTPFKTVLLGSQSFESGAADAIFYDEFATGTGTFQAASTANQTTTCGPLTVTEGYYSIFRCKFNPLIFSVGPLTPNVSGLVVESGGSITISGVGFGQQCSGCQVVAYPGPLVLQLSSWSDSSITAPLPSTFNGIAEVAVQAAAGSDSMTFMAAPPALASPAIALSTSSLTFSFIVGGEIPPLQTISVLNTGGGSLSYTATSSANWLLVHSSGNLITALISPANLAPNTYQGTITVSAPGAANSPQTVSVTMVVTGNTPTVSISSITNAATGVQGALAPGEFFTIKGTNLGPAVGVSFSVNAGGMVNTTLAGSVVMAGSVAAPILYSSATQINAMVPYEIAGQSQAVIQVQYQGAFSAGTSVQVASAAPGLFTFNSTGTGPAAAVNQDGSLNGSSNPTVDGFLCNTVFHRRRADEPSGGDRFYHRIVGAEMARSACDGDGRRATRNGSVRRRRAGLH